MRGGGAKALALFAPPRNGAPRTSRKNPQDRPPGTHIAAVSGKKAHRAKPAEAS